MPRIIDEKKVVLLIEDNVDDEHLTLRALRRNNVMNEVIVACDGEEGLSYLFKTGSYAGRDARVLPSVVLLDLNLPGLSGLDVLRKIRSEEATKTIPIVILTSAASDAKAAECYALGANSFVQKPSDPVEFSEVVLELTMYWLLLNHVPTSFVSV